jgi:hypothetical protein
MENLTLSAILVNSSRIWRRWPATFPPGCLKRHLWCLGGSNEQGGALYLLSDLAARLRRHPSGKAPGHGAFCFTHRETGRTGYRRMP